MHVSVPIARVKLMPGNFIDASVNDEKLRDIKLVFMTALCSDDKKLRDIKLVFMTALCSKSGVANPVSFVVTEGEGKSADCAASSLGVTRVLGAWAQNLLNASRPT